MENIIRTKIDPKEIRAKYSRVLCQDGEFQVTADAEIVNEDYDEARQEHLLQIGLHYPRRSTRTVIMSAIPARQDGKRVAVKPPEHWMTQEDFDGMLKGEHVEVPTYA
jgi:hypothetical protein